jgi:hypothetical protein
MERGMADRMILNNAFAIVSPLLVCHTSLKSRGRLLKAEKRSLILTSDIVVKSRPFQVVGVEVK